VRLKLNRNREIFLPSIDYTQDTRIESSRIAFRRWTKFDSIDQLKVRVERSLKCTVCEKY